MKERIKTPEKELSDKAVANLSDAEFQTLVIRMLTGMIELGCKKKEEMKSIQSEIKENIQGNNSEGKETRTQCFGLEGRNKHSIGKVKKQEFKKLRRCLGTSGQL